MADDQGIIPDDISSTKSPGSNWKWLFGIVGALVVCFQAFDWIERRIEKRITEREQVTSAIESLKSRQAQDKSWIDGRLNTLSAQLETTNRELLLLRQSPSNNTTRSSDPATPR